MFKSIAEVKEANKKNGYHFFDKETMKFFRSTIVSDLIAGQYFITSEVNPEGERSYSVRVVSENGRVQRMGDFPGYKTKYSAEKAIETLLAA